MISQFYFLNSNLPLTIHPNTLSPLFFLYNLIPSQITYLLLGKLAIILQILKPTVILLKNVFLKLSKTLHSLQPNCSCPEKIISKILHKRMAIKRVAPPPGFILISFDVVDLLPNISKAPTFQFLS